MTVWVLFGLSVLGFCGCCLYILRRVKKRSEPQGAVESDESYEASEALMKAPEPAPEPLAEEPAPASQPTTIGAALVKALKSPAKLRKAVPKKVVVKKK
jgi:hypothetical protein